jgi:hypothetical protein
MILDEARLADLSVLQQSKRRRALLDSIINSFRRTFQELEFELNAENTMVNAQASTLHGRRYVRIYGGLAFHPLVGRQLLIFILLHETGHHLAGGIRLPWDPRLACECVSDHWAVTQGAAALRASSGTRLVLSLAIRQMDLFFKHQRHLDILAAADRRECWAFAWAKRKRSLATNQQVGNPICPLAKFVLPHAAH